jgi:hypothetical protein
LLRSSWNKTQIANNTTWNRHCHKNISPQLVNLTVQYHLKLLFATNNANDKIKSHFTASFVRYIEVGWLKKHLKPPPTDPPPCTNLFVRHSSTQIQNKTLTLPTPFRPRAYFTDAPSFKHKFPSPKFFNLRVKTLGAVTSDKLALLEVQSDMNIKSNSATNNTSHNF